MSPPTLSRVAFDVFMTMCHIGKGRVCLPQNLTNFKVKFGVASPSIVPIGPLSIRDASVNVKVEYSVTSSSFMVNLLDQSFLSIYLMAMQPRNPFIKTTSAKQIYLHFNNADY